MREENEKPALGSRDLEVRLPPDAHADVSVDEKGFVRPGTGGMSVSPRLIDLPAHRVPRRLRSIFPAAVGSNTLRVWSMGEGSFAAASFDFNLSLRLDPKRKGHGFVEPENDMGLSDYINAIEGTRDAWRLDEI